MAIVKITDLPAADSPISSSDVAPVVQGGVTKKAQIDQLGFTPVGANAITRTFQGRMREYLSAKDFGAVGDGVADDTIALNNFFAAVATTNSSNGHGVIPAGTYRVTSPIVVAGKIDTNPSTLTLQIDAYGAKIAPSGFSGIVFEVRDCKQFNLAGLSVQGSINVNGLWFSTWRDVRADGTWYFLNGPNSYFYTVYWSSFIDCVSYGGMVWDCRSNAQKGGSGGALAEVAANVFNNFQIKSGTSNGYGIEIYGTGQCQQNTFFGGDISYYSTGLFYVATARGGSCDLYGVYLDSPVQGTNLNGFTVNFYHCVTANDNSINATLGTLAASKTYIDEIGGSRMRTRLPTSSGNLVPNGDLATLFATGAPPNFTVNNFSVTRQVDTAAPNQWKQYLRATSSTPFALLQVATIPVPATGVYNITFVGRVSGNIINVINPSGPGELYSGIGVGSDWTVCSLEFYATANSQINIAFTKSAESTATTFDIAYVGVTAGRFGQLYAPMAPAAYQASSGLFQFQWNKTINSATPILTLDFTSDFTYSQNEITIFGQDTVYEEGNAYRKYVLLANRAGGATTASLTSLGVAHDGNLTGDISLATSIVSNVISVNATAPNGAMGARIWMTSSGNRGREIITLV